MYGERHPNSVVEIWLVCYLMEALKWFCHVFCVCVCVFYNMASYWNNFLQKF